MTLAFEDANPKLLDVVSVADVVAKKRVDNSFVKILKLKFVRIFERLPDLKLRPAVNGFNS